MLIVHDASCTPTATPPKQMPTASGSRRPPTTRATKPTPKPNDVDDLTQKLATKLTLADPKGKRKASVKQTPEEIRNDAMRLINTNSQNLSVLVQSGWKASEAKKPSDPKLQSPTTVKAQAGAVRSSLQLLRGLSQDVDVERAALSFAGKLISLDLVSLLRSDAYSKLIREIVRLRTGSPHGHTQIHSSTLFTRTVQCSKVQAIEVGARETLPESTHSLVASTLRNYRPIAFKTNFDLSATDPDGLYFVLVHRKR